jgi:hypothetical protein
MLGTSDAWLTSHLSQQTSKPAYYVVDCRISYLWSLLCKHIYCGLITIANAHVAFGQHYYTGVTQFTRTNSISDKLFHTSLPSENKWMKFLVAGPLLAISNNQFGCGILKMVGPKMQDFCQRNNMLKENCFKTILRWIMVCQKVPKSYFQFSTSKIDGIFSIYVIQFRKPFFVQKRFFLTSISEPLYFLKSCSISYIASIWKQMN